MTDDPWLVRLNQVNKALTTLVCFPHAGGSASYFHPLASRLGGEVEVLAVQYPGRQERRHEPLIGTIKGLVEEISPRLAGLTESPVALFGHSMGATVAFEVTREMEAARTSGPTVLFLSGRQAPSCAALSATRPPTDHELLDEIARLDGTQSEFLRDKELLAMVLPALRADYKALAAHRADPWARVRAAITALGGDADPMVDADGLDAWKMHTESSFTRHSLPGGHFYLNTHVSAVADVVRERLRRDV